jgi:hypothetical protein
MKRKQLIVHCFSLPRGKTVCTSYRKALPKLLCGNDASKTGRVSDRLIETIALKYVLLIEIGEKTCKNNIFIRLKNRDHRRLVREAIAGCIVCCLGCTDPWSRPMRN